MGFPASDIEIAVSSFVGVMVAEVIVKPIAIRTGRLIIRAVDKRIGDLLPDWLWHPNNKN
jgi:hypothetical protein